MIKSCNAWVYRAFYGILASQTHEPVQTVLRTKEGLCCSELFV